MSKDREFLGVTVKDCCLDCSAEKCVISGTNVCGHPYKSSHPGASAAVTERILHVKKMIAIQRAGGGKEEDHAVNEPGPARVRRNVAHRRRKAKAARPRKDADADERGERLPAGGQGPEDRPTGETRP